MSSATSSRLVVGLQPVREAIRRHGSALREVLIDEKASPKLEALARFAADQAVPRVQRVRRAVLDQLSHGVSHQGVAAHAPELALATLDAIAGDSGLIAVALDAIQDPQNFGAVVRSAVALGGAAVVWGAHASAPLTPATFRASAGAIEHARLCRVPSLHEALGTLRDGGVRVVGLDANAPQRLADVELTGPCALVLGGEGEGLGRAVRRSCSTLAALSGMASIDSLNVSVAAGIALYETLRQRVKSEG
ncbi:MAG TPA: RNA methyltransferase [Polyangiaceae bacterium]|nr:RNA methyltransferase [Polyangiaceae bacterium]